jgi:siroheme synthase-like protein
METEVLHKEEIEQLEESVNRLFPVFLKLENLQVLLVGAGNVGLEKLTAMLQNAPNTHITVVAGKVSDKVKHFSASASYVTIIERDFEPADLLLKDIVVIAVNDKNVSQEIRELAKEKNLLVNVADTPGLCDFYLGSIVQKGSVKIAISTNGKSPTMAKRLKEVLNVAIPAEINNATDNLHIIRNRLNGSFATRVKKLDELTRGLVEKDNAEKEKQWKRIATISITVFALMLLGHFIFSYIP